MKTKLVLLFSTIFIIAATTSSMAQTQTIQEQITQAENDYRYQFDQYRQSYSEYTRTKAVWLSSKTLKAEQEALAAGKDAASDRDVVMIAYIRWLRLQLLQFASTYSKAITVAEKLDTQSQWFDQHRIKVEAVTNITNFDLVMAEYADPKTAVARDAVFSVAQLELKLAHLAFFQHQARALYDPVLKILETKTHIPEVEQGFVRINDLNNKINTDLVDISTFGGSIEAESFNSTQFFRNVNDRLATLQANQISMLNFIIELESRYGQQ